jgi:hypothetical protein
MIRWTGSMRRKFAASGREALDTLPLYRMERKKYA